MVQNFRGRNIHEFRGFRATCESFLCEMVTSFQFVKVFSLKNFPLYGMLYSYNYAGYWYQTTACRNVLLVFTPIILSMIVAVILLHYSGELILSIAPCMIN